jgi:hypothetical protein
MSADALPAATRLEARPPNSGKPDLETLLQNYSTLLPADIASMKKIRHSSKKRPNRNFAMAAAPAAMPVNPNSAATIAIIRKITAQRNIVLPPLK